MRFKSPFTFCLLPSPTSFNASLKAEKNDQFQQENESAALTTLFFYNLSACVLQGVQHDTTTYANS